MQKRKWNSVLKHPKQYSNLFPINDGKITQFFDKLSECDSLFEFDHDAGCDVQVIDCYNPKEITWQTLFEHENKFMFHFKHLLSCYVESVQFVQERENVGLL